MVYRLTQWSYGAAPILQIMGRWGARSPEHDRLKPFIPASAMVSLCTMNDTERALGLTAKNGFRPGPRSFLLHLADGRPAAVRGDFGAADLYFTGFPRAVAAAVYNGAPLADLQAQGAQTKGIMGLPDDL